MSASRPRKDLSAALALLVLTGSAISAAPAFAADADAQDQASAQIQQAETILDNLQDDQNLSDSQKAKIESARQLLRDATDTGKFTAERPTCAE